MIAFKTDFNSKILNVSHINKYYLRKTRIPKCGVTGEMHYCFDASRLWTMNQDRCKSNICCRQVGNCGDIDHSDVKQKPIYPCVNND